MIDEADRMIERGHFPELESIIRMLPRLDVATAPDDNATPTPNNRPPRRQTFVFSATLTISPDARRKIGAGKKKAAALAKAKQKYKKKGKNHADDGLWDYCIGWCIYWLQSRWNDCWRWSTSIAK